MNHNDVYAEIDTERVPACVLCLCGVPGGKGIMSHHHICTRGELPGDSNEEMLWSKYQIALACNSHHARFGHPPFRGLWALAMIQMNQSCHSDSIAFPFLLSNADAQNFP